MKEKTELYDCIKCGVQPELKEYIYYDEYGENGTQCAYYICPKCKWSTGFRNTKEVATEQWQSNNMSSESIFGRIVYDGLIPDPVYIDIKELKEEEE